MAIQEHVWSFKVGLVSFNVPHIMFSWIYANNTVNVVF